MYSIKSENLNEVHEFWDPTYLPNINQEGFNSLNRPIANKVIETIIKSLLPKSPKEQKRNQIKLNQTTTKNSKIAPNRFTLKFYHMLKMHCNKLLLKSSENYLFTVGMAIACICTFIIKERYNHSDKIFINWLTTLPQKETGSSK